MNAEELAAIRDRKVPHGPNAVPTLTADRDALLAEVERLQAKLAELHDDHMFLEALETAGVDNWDGYSYAHEIFEEWTGGERE